MLVLGLLLIRRRRRRRTEPAFPLDLIDEEPKPYILPGRSEAENSSHRPESAYRRSVPPLLTGAHHDSKSRAQMTFYPRGGEPVSEEGLLSPQERSAASGSGSYGRTNSTATAGHGYETSGPMSGTSDLRSGTSASRSGTIGSRSGGSGPRSGTSSSRSDSTSWRQRRRDTKTPSSPRGAGESSEPAVQEEDAGVVLEPEDEPVARTLPPAYNPEWDRG